MVPGVMGGGRGGRVLVGHRGMGPGHPTATVPHHCALYCHCTHHCALYCHCTLPGYSTVLPLYTTRVFHCTATVPPLQIHCTATVPPLQIHCTGHCTLPGYPTVTSPVTPSLATIAGYCSGGYRGLWNQCRNAAHYVLENACRIIQD